jgi:hypothetical protein
MVDWGRGRYEETATELEPVALHVLSLADFERGKRVAIPRQGNEDPRAFRVYSPYRVIEVYRLRRS